MEIHDEALEKLLLRGCSHKKKIRNKEQADRSIDYLASKGVLMYYYNCPFCSKFHLTSSPPSEEFNQAILKAIIKRANSYEREGTGPRQDHRGVQKEFRKARDHNHMRPRKGEEIPVSET